MKRYFIVLIATIALIAAGCSKAPKEEKKSPAKGDSLIIVKVDSNNKIRFSGITWTATGEDKETSSYDFSVYSSDNVFIDSMGRLHMLIQKKGDVWYGAGLTADSSLGFGEYVFYVDSKLDNLDRNACLNLGVENANPPESIRGLSQLGVQICHWGDTESQNALQYFLYSTNKKISEVHTPKDNFVQNENKSVHHIVINPDMLYIGSTNNSGSKIFDQLRLTAKDKSKRNTDVDEITFSKPCAKNRFAITFTLPEANEPLGGKAIEIIISRVEFKPAVSAIARNIRG